MADRYAGPLLAKADHSGFATISVPAFVSLTFLADVVKSQEN